MTRTELFDEPERYELREPPRYRFELDRRDFCKVLGGGLLVCLVLDDAEAQQRRGPGRGRMPQELGAWLHIDESGQVTVYTGKVEVGQNIRTSLSQAVAEELRLPIASVRLVMADTAQTPFDGGTAGSRTTPDMASQLRRVAAAAREMLLDLGSEALSVERSTLHLGDGRVVHDATKRSLTLGELTKGKKLTRTVSERVPVTPAAEWKVAGQSVPKVDGRAFVTGQHRFTSDIKRPGMLVGKVLRAPAVGATAARVNVQPAKAIEGVVVVQDGAFVGVAAANEQKAEEALAAIDVQWQQPPTGPNSTSVFDHLKKNRGPGPGFGGRSNQAVGSIEKGMAAAEHKLSATYTIAYIAHAPLEPRAAVAEWEAGRLTVWTGTQRPFGVRGELARAFGLDEAQVRVIVPDTGSGYGGKHTGEAAIEAARLAKAAGKPVKLVWTREEEFTWAYFRPAGVIDIAAGINSDGSLVAWECHNYNSGGSALRPLYEIPNLKAEFHGSQSPLRQGSYRALAATANHFARECHMDDLARAAGLDPLEFRKRNLKDARLRAVLEAAAARFGWGKAKLAPGSGVGLACGFEKGSYVASCAEVAIEPGSGKLRVRRVVTAFECGAIVNPDHLTSQVEGSVMMGLGGALFEAIDFDSGKIRNASFADYRVPRFSDLPILETVLVDRKDLPSAGAGETPIVAVAPAIGNAIAAATGVRLRSLPMAPRGVVTGASA